MKMSGSFLEWVKTLSNEEKAALAATILNRLTRSEVERVGKEFYNHLADDVHDELVIQGEDRDLREDLSEEVEAYQHRIHKMRVKNARNQKRR